MAPFPQMIHAALQSEWDRLDAMISALRLTCRTTTKGPQALFKALLMPPNAAFLAASLRDAHLRERAGGWRAEVVAALVGRGSDAETAAMLFATWQGQTLWDHLGDKGFKLKDAIKRLS